MFPQHRRYVRLRTRGENDQENRSMLLQDFLKGRYPNMELRDVISHVCQFARDRDGSKFIQLKLDAATDQDKWFIFREMQPNLLTLMMDRFGNFIVQKFIEIGSEEQRQVILTLVQFHCMVLSRNKYACRVVQRAIEYTTNYNREHEILQQFYGPNIVALAQDPNGNHVIQTCFRSVMEQIQINLYLHIHAHVTELSYHMHGCRVVQCILEHGTDLLRSNVFNQIVNNALAMIQDRYGNYVIQSAIQCCPSDMKNYLIEFVLEDVVFMSGHKYSSNVVEKCIGVATPLQKEQAMDLICSHPPRWLKRFCTDKFANYVVQKLIEGVDIQQVNMLYNKIKPHFNEMERHVCGRKIVNSLKERMDEAINMHFNQLLLSE